MANNNQIIHVRFNSRINLVTNQLSVIIVPRNIKCKKLTHSWVSLLSGDLDPGRVTFSFSVVVVVAPDAEFWLIFRDCCVTKVRVSCPFGKGFESVMMSSISSDGDPPGRFNELPFCADATRSLSPAVCNVIWLVAVGPDRDRNRSNSSFEFPSKSSYRSNG